jgi:hypothetical protein
MPAEKDLPLPMFGRATVEQPRIAVDVIGEFDQSYREAATD